MKNIKKVFALTLCAAMILPAAACSSDEASEPEETTMATVIMTTAPAAETTAAADAVNAWTCPECGTMGNTGVFCNNCGADKPDNATSDPIFTEVTPIPYETEETVGQGANEDTFGTYSPMPFTDLETGLDLYLNFYGTVTYDGEFEDTVNPLVAYVITYAEPRMYNLLSRVPYSELEDNYEELELGIASDLRDNLGFTNVTVEIQGVSLDENSQAAYDEALGN